MKGEEEGSRKEMGGLVDTGAATLVQPQQKRECSDSVGFSVLR